MSQPSTDRLVRTNELAEIFDVTPMTIWRWRRAGLIEPPVQAGPNVVGWWMSTVIKMKESLPQAGDIRSSA